LEKFLIEMDDVFDFDLDSGLPSPTKFLLLKMMAEFVLLDFFYMPCWNPPAAS